MTASATPTAPRKRGRPRKDQSRPDAPRMLLVRAGVAVLTEKGFSAVSVDEILSAASVPKGSFYHYFDSKESFGMALIDAYADYFARKLDRWFEDETHPPLARLGHFFADAKAGMARFGYRRGCLVGNLGQEMGALPESFRARLARFFWIGWEGAVLRAKLERDPTPLDEFAMGFMALLQSGSERG